MAAPHVYVVPTSEMEIKAGHSCTAATGRVTTQCLRTWTFPRSTLRGCLEDTAAMFGREPPVHSKPLPPLSSYPIPHHADPPPPPPPPPSYPPTNPGFTNPILHPNPPPSNPISNFVSFVTNNAANILGGGHRPSDGSAAAPSGASFPGPSVVGGIPLADGGAAARASPARDGRPERGRARAGVSRRCGGRSRVPGEAVGGSVDVGHGRASVRAVGEQEPAAAAAGGAVTDPHTPRGWGGERGGGGGVRG